MMAEPRTRSAFTIDVVSDVVCPWCYIGKRRLAAALNRIAQRRGDVDFRVSWHPFQLNPELPADGVDRKRYLEDKFGGPERAAEIYARVREAGTSVGIPFALERILRQPNTLDAHRLIGWAQRQRAADGLVEALFRAYFIDGRYLGDRGELAAIAAEAGFAAAAAQTMLDGAEGVDEVRSMDARVRELGVTGVPFFIFDNRFAVSGAQEPEALVGVIEEALATEAGAG
jgi:predicted DsbA family dithiol-disulfide isomerase